MGPRLMHARTPTEATAAAHGGAGAAADLFVALDGRRALIAGGTPAAAWKAELLSAAGAAVDVYAHETMRRVARACERSAARAGQPASRVHGNRRTLPARRSQSAPASDDAEAERFASAARAAHVPVNVIDKPAFCDFSFGADRQPLAARHRHLDRRRGAGVRPDDPGQARSDDPARLRALGRGRPALAARRCSRPDCRSTRAGGSGSCFTAHAVEPSRTSEPQQADFDRLLAETTAEATAVENGSVTLVGAGPGDPELLTLARGARAAIGRCHPVRRSGVARGARVRAPRGEEDAGRQDRLRTVLPAGRDQRSDDRACLMPAGAWCGSRAAIR